MVSYLSFFLFASPFQIVFVFVTAANAFPCLFLCANVSVWVCLHWTALEPQKRYTVHTQTSLARSLTRNHLDSHCTYKLQWTLNVLFGQQVAGGNRKHKYTIPTPMQHRQIATAAWTIKKRAVIDNIGTATVNQMWCDVRCPNRTKYHFSLSNNLEK